MLREERASEIAKSAEFALQKLAPVTSKTLGDRVSVYYARGSDGLRAIRTGSSLDEGIALAGGRNVVSTGEGTFSSMSVDEVAALKPSVVVLADPKAAEPGAPLRKALPAETRFLVDLGLPYGWIEHPPSLNRLIGALWLASHLYPDEISFPAEDARRMSVALFHQAPHRSNDQRNASLILVLQFSKHERHGFSEMNQKTNLTIADTRRGLAALVFSLVIAASRHPSPGSTTAGGTKADSKGSGCLCSS